MPDIILTGSHVQISYMPELFIDQPGLDPLCSVKAGSPLAGCGFSPRTDGLDYCVISKKILHLSQHSPGWTRTSVGSTPNEGTTSVTPLTPKYV